MDRQRARETASFETAVIASNSSDSIPTTECSNDDFVIDLEKPTTSGESYLKKRRKISDTHLLATLDVAKISDRSASLVMIPMIKNLGENPRKFPVSYSSIRRARKQFRKNFADNLRDEFKPDISLTIHWDEKILEDIAEEEVVDRLPVLVSRNGVEQLLEVSKLDHCTGKATSDAVYERITEWRLSDRI